MNRFKRASMVLLVILLTLSLAPIPSFAAEGRSFNSQQKDGYTVSFYQDDVSSITLDFQLGDYAFSETSKDGITYTKIDFDGGVVTTDRGYAEVPFIHAALQLPPDKNVSLLVEDTTFVDYPLTDPLLPSRGVIYRDQDPESLPYIIDPASLTDEWYPTQLAESTAPFILRDVRGINVYVYPFRYNGASQTLRVYTSVTVKLVQDTSRATNQLLVAPGHITAEMDPLYRSIFINYDAGDTFSQANVSRAVDEMGEILVVYTSRDASVIQPYVEWKREKGFRVHTQQVATGTNVKNTIRNAYNANQNILYVQLVGDWADIKSDLGGGANAPMDPMLGCVVGSDNYPDLIIGRFSANNTTHVSTQINKAINYERSPGGSWYYNGMGIASSEGAGMGDDGESDIQHQAVIRDYKLLPYTYISSGYTSAFGDGTSKSVLRNAVNAGLSIINYTGHGSSTSWGTTGFNNYDVNALTNGSKLPVIISVACVNGAFHNSSDCFAEAWLRKENGGAVATLMSTINQPWQPPMRGQDYMNDLLIGGYNYSSNPGNGISTSEGRTTFGSIVFNGLILMYTESSGSSDLQTIQTWTLFGDSSLQVRTDTPRSTSLSNTQVDANTPFSTRVTASGVGVKDALVSLSRGSTVFSALTDSAGNVTLNHTLSAGPAKLVVTGLNLATVYLNVTIQDGTPPEAPSNLQAQAVSDVQIDLGWTDNASGEDSFEIQRKTGAGAFATVATVGANVTSYNDTGLTPETTYTYRVRALRGGSSSAWSNETSATTQAPVPPNPPSNLAVTASSASQIDLTWTDNATDEDGFELQRKTGTGTFATIATLGANVSAYSDTGLTPETTYTYRVRATKGNTNSAWSNEAAATTPSGPVIVFEDDFETDK
ncbi:MAG TPA: hypothetical protein ENN19_04465, partial [Chloroflexi bacterium]|nr:hypothetical protein [Chloroflexota bacterium]